MAREKKEAGADESVYGARPHAEKVARLGVVRAKGYLYVLDVELSVVRSALDPESRELGEPELVVRVEHAREEGWFYFLDADGDLARSPAQGS
ncbi:MAG: hypothetical protein IT383_02805 [Deltaproteobacteria bacterium]|nr:hypothetical protein [Deltaproteobacteria bacterium]